MKFPLKMDFGIWLTDQFWGAFDLCLTIFFCLLGLILGDIGFSLLFGY